MRQMFRTVVVVAMTGVAGAACATKGFVRESVGEVNQKVETLGQSLEATQQQTKENAARITQVDQKADQAGAAAQTAQGSATAARGAADAAAAKATAVEASTKRLIFQVVVSDDQGNFELGKADLPADVRLKLDELAKRLKADPAGNYIEIEGHTDATGSTEANERLGLARAENVKRYLYETYQIPLHKINVISYGEDKPVAPNDTRAGRAQNRRVVIKVLA
ncbi:MAG TPA: OmpA family protein [Vicinamibacterales bacterium]|nr:OmpA family protein [Vicinamibacterales bacterium]